MIVEVDALVRVPTDQPDVEARVARQLEIPAFVGVVVRERAPRGRVTPEAPRDGKEA